MNSTNNRWADVPFGSGPRKCAGQHIARSSLKRLVYSICVAGADFFDEKFQPSVGSAHSGRHNDGGGSGYDLFYGVDGEGHGEKRGGVVQQLMGIGGKFWG